MTFNSLNLPQLVTFTPKLSGKELHDFANESRLPIPAYLHDRELKFKEFWFDWISLAVCAVFSVWFAVFYWDDGANTWLILSLVLGIYVLWHLLQILEKSHIISLHLGSFLRPGEFEEIPFKISNSYAYTYKVPQIIRFSFGLKQLVVVQVDKKIGEIEIAIPWDQVRQIKPFIYFGKPSVGFSFYDDAIIVNPEAETLRIKEQLQKTRAKVLGIGYGQVIIPSAPFALNPISLAKQADTYADFVHEYYPNGF